MNTMQLALITTGLITGGIIGKLIYLNKKKDKEILKLQYIIKECHKIRQGGGECICQNY